MRLIAKVKTAINILIKISLWTHERSVRKFLLNIYGLLFGGRF
jgi:hypothetical protein